MNGRRARGLQDFGQVDPVEERRSAVSWYRAVVDAFPRAVIVTASDGEILLWSREAEQLYGLPEASAVGRTAGEILVPLLGTALGQQVLEAARLGNPWRGDFILNRADGTVVRVTGIDGGKPTDDATVIVGAEPAGHAQ
jgi:PAS domain S-box-containing protein